MPADDRTGVADDFLPAAPFLTSPAAFDVLAPAIAATGAELASCRPVQVHYRPGHELAVRYAATTHWPDGRSEQLTVLAGTTVDGPPPGTLVVTADVGTVAPLEVGVWRWPFDPSLPGLTAAVTPPRAVEVLGDALVAPFELEVIVYRPTERAVVRLTDAHGTSAFVKVVPPDTAIDLVARHQLLAAAGLPVPDVIAHDDTLGVVALTEVPGPTLRELVKGTPGTWPPAAEFLALRDQLARVPIDAPGRAARRADAVGHAAMLAAVLPGERSRLESLTQRWRQSSLDEQSRVPIHGDLHEAQMMVTDGRISGLIDVDDVGVGDALDDLATLLGHLAYRALTTVDAHLAIAIGAYARRLRSGFADGGVPIEPLDATTAAVLVGLATGPFRVQMEGWKAFTSATLDVVEGLLDGRGLDERTLRTASSGAHRAASS